MNKAEKIENLKKKSPFKLFDVLVIGVLLVVSVCLVVFLPQKKGAYAEVYVDNKLVLTRPLNVDYEVKILTNNGEHYNVVKIENGYVFISDSDCDDKVCINTGKTNTSNKSIICLPHNLKIIVVNSIDDDVDIVI